MDEFDKRAEEYVASAIQGNDGLIFSRSELCKFIKNAWMTGYAEGATTVNYFQCRDCPKKHRPKSIMFIEELTKIKDE